MEDINVKTKDDHTRQNVENIMIEISKDNEIPVPKEEKKATTETEVQIDDLKRFEILIKDPFYNLPLSCRQWNVMWIFLIRQYYSCSCMFFFAIYATGDDPKALGFTAIMIGWQLTAQFIQPFADIYGRLILYRSCLVLQLIGTILLFTLPFNQSVFMCICGVIGVGFGPSSSLQHFIWNEALPLRMVNITVNVQFGAWAFVIPTVLYFWIWLRSVIPSNIDAWRTGMATASIFLLVHICCTFLLSPSVPWLISQGRIAEAKKSTSHIYAGDKNADRLELWDYLQQQQQHRSKKVNAKTPFRKIWEKLWSWEFRLTLFAGILQFTSCGLQYWGQSLQVAKFLPSAANNTELVLSLMGLVELPASVLAWWLPRHIGFVQSLVLMFLLQGIFNLCLFGELYLAYVALFCTRLVTSVLYNMVFMLCTLTFPPDVRSTGGGLLSNMGRIGSIFAPMLGFLPSYQVIWLCSLLSFVSAISCVGYSPNKYFATMSKDLLISAKKK